MDIEAQKRQAAALAVEWVRPGMRLGLGTGSTARHFVELLAERVRAGLDVVGVADLGGDARRRRAPGRAAHHARRDARARPDRRRRRRDRARPEPDQGRRRRAAAREDRGGGLGPHGGDRRREQMGPGARPLSVADRGGAVRPGRDAAGGRGRRRRRRLSRAGPAAAGQERPRFRHGQRSLDTRCRARPDRRSQHRWPTGCRPFPAWSSTVCSSGWRKPLFWPGPPVSASSSGREQPVKRSRDHDIRQSVRVLCARRCRGRRHSRGR